MLNVSKATVIVRTGGHLVEPIAMVLFSVCSAVTVECCVLYPCCVGVFAVM